MRVGVHHGSVISGVVGSTKFQFDIWGDTVNIASRKESHGAIEHVNVSETIYKMAKEEFNFKRSAKDILITSQLRTAFILNKNIKATNYQIDTYKKKIYVYGIALTSEEKDLVISEAKEILDVEDVIASIILVEDLRIQRE